MTVQLTHLENELYLCYAKKEKPRWWPGFSLFLV